MRVKICGITSSEDARLALDNGAAAIGLIFAEGSKRQVDLEAAQAISASVGPFAYRVGVFRNQPLDWVLGIAAELRLEAVQLHGAEDPDYVAAVGRQRTVIRALSHQPGMGPADLDAWPADYILLDAAVPGSGVAFDWEAAAGLAGHPKLILAGGLTPDNVAEAIRLFQPRGVDVASGVEQSAGRKSPSLVRSFMEAVGGSPRVSTGPSAY